MHISPFIALNPNSCFTHKAPAVVWGFTLPGI